MTQEAKIWLDIDFLTSNLSEGRGATAGISHIQGILIGGEIKSSYFIDVILD
ncbi:MAG: hypothetical protein Ct9H300mP21_11310 [Pseudomonadota bacterium]|nr:MAG: hypothetical protein Ct9H300mP21_11310 [Pseudomonadota bacterium]